MILAILQARNSSSRLPKKVTKTILGKPMLLHQIERLKHSQMIDEIVVATSTSTSDDAIEKMCLDSNVEVFRGDLNNVLDRFYKCAKVYNSDYIVRVTGDCPLTDWQVVDQTIKYFFKGDFDYVATSIKFPDGLDAEIMTISALKSAWKGATLPSEIEHVTQYIVNRIEKFNNGIFEPTRDLSYLRWTVDEPEDFVLVKKIYQALYEDNPLFLTDDILNLLERQPELTKINNCFIRNEGLENSLKEDKEFLKNV
jgi:spore coat polysaccharide biosynthesis protein SpsF (cytidylyltransferase family)